MSVTVLLKAPDAAALQSLAAHRATNKAARLRQLTTLVPSTSAHDTAVAGLSRAGLTVTRQTSWSVTATGPVDTVNALFGRRPSLAAHATVTERRAAFGRLPHLPASLQAVALAAYPVQGAAAVHPLTTLSGSDLRNAYTSPGVAAPDGSDPDGHLTIATLQFSSWNPSDLTTFAQRNGLGLSAGQYTSVTVDGGPIDSAGDGEVALDQETLLAAAPNARQRVYFAPATNAGYPDALSQVFDDVTRDQYAVGGGDSSIAAVSTSWGACEQQWDNIPQVENILHALVAAGVTIFAAAGDQGIYDCAGSSGPRLQGTSAAVDYPAASPSVVAVGGTSLNTSDGASNNGSNWNETAWSCTSVTDCLSNGGTGGGASSIFSKPSWQSGLTNSADAASAARLLPDIAVDADPNTGVWVYTSDLSNCGATSCIVGGTSLAAPLSAALLTNLLASYGRTAGVGDIHSALYSAGSAGFRDITSGSNGASSDAGSDPSVIASAGYDTVTGLGAPLWPSLASSLLDLTAAPVTTASLALTTPHSTTSPRTVTARWSSLASARGTGARSAHVVISRVGTNAISYDAATASPTGSYTFTGAAGATYRLSITPTSVSGVLGTAVTRTVTVPVDDRSFHKVGIWRQVPLSSDVAGSHGTTSSKGAYATVTAAGRTYELLLRTGPSYGKLAVYFGRTRLTTIDLYARSSGYRTIRFYSGGSATRTFSLRYTGLRNSSSRGTTITLDGLIVLP
jgi:pseudomonalisin